MIRLIFLLSLCLQLNAGTVTLSWDPNDSADNILSYYVYDHRTNVIETGGVPIVDNFWMVPIGNTINTELMLDIPSGAYNFTCTASNEFGESNFSSQISVLVPPGPPVNLRFRFPQKGTNIVAATTTYIPGVALLYWSNNNITWNEWGVWGWKDNGPEICELELSINKPAQQLFLRIDNLER